MGHEEQPLPQPRRGMGAKAIMDEKVIVYRHSEKQVVLAKELQEGDKIIGLKMGGFERVLKEAIIK